MPAVKQIVLWLVVVFVAYAVYKNPTSAANLLGSAWDLLTSAVRSIFSFFDGILARS